MCYGRMDHGSVDQSGSVRDVCMSHQSDWIYYKQPIKFLVFVAGTCKMILVFLFQVVAIKTDKSVTFVHTVRINNLEANLAAHPDKVWTFLFFNNVFSGIFLILHYCQFLKTGISSGIPEDSCRRVKPQTN